jgi:hypothetical protein
MSILRIHVSFPSSQLCQFCAYMYLSRAVNYVNSAHTSIFTCSRTHAYTCRPWMVCTHTLFLHTHINYTYTHSVAQDREWRGCWLAVTCLHTYIIHTHTYIIHTHTVLPKTVNGVDAGLQWPACTRTLFIHAHTLYTHTQCCPRPWKAWMLACNDKLAHMHYPYSTRYCDLLVNIHDSHTPTFIHMQCCPRPWMAWMLACSALCAQHSRALNSKLSTGTF